MSDLYDDLKDLATDLISEFGRKTGIKIHHCKPVKDVVSGNFSGTEIIESVNGIVVNVSGKLMSDVRMVGNASIMTTDKEVLIPANVTVSDSDKLEFDGFVWAILKLDPCKPANTLVYWDIWVRR